MVQWQHHRETLLQKTLGSLSYTAGLLGRVCFIWVEHGEGMLESSMPFVGSMGLFYPIDGATGVILLEEGMCIYVAFFLSPITALICTSKCVYY